MLHFLGVCAVIWMIWAIFFKKPVAQQPWTVNDMTPQQKSSGYVPNERAQEIIKKHQALLFTDDATLIEELDKELIAMKELVDNLGSSDELHRMADNFINKAMRLSDPSVTIAYVRIALTEYRLPFEPTKLKSFEQFHRLHSSQILS
jgi:hypothetical protein